MTILDKALEYAESGLSVIPLLPGKKIPPFEWKKYQTEIAQPAQIEAWFSKWKDCNIGIVTGEVSGIGVIDLDTKEALLWAENNLPKTNITQTTSKGQHWIYKRNSKPIPQGSNMIANVPGVDLRGEGGYIVAAPSVHPTGMVYEFNILFGDWDDLPVFPYDLFTAQTIKKEPVTIAPIQEGSRDDSLTRVAGKYFAKGLDYNEVLAMCHGVNLGYNPPLSNKDVEKIVASIAKKEEALHTHPYASVRTDTQPDAQQCNVDDFRTAYDSNNDRKGSISWLIDGYIADNAGISFTNFDMDREFSLTTRSEKEARRQALSRREKSGKIKRLQGRSGGWKVLDQMVIATNFKGADSTPFSLPLMLGIGDITHIYNGSMVLVAGTSNCGKTALLMRTLKSILFLTKERAKSMKGKPLYKLAQNGIRYLNSEMGSAEILEWQDSLEYPITNSGVEFVERYENFAEALIPDGINFIDYLEVGKDFYMVGEMLREIHDELRSGVAIISVQKKQGAETAIGGQFTMHKPRLVINLEKTDSAVKIAKLTKVKRAVDRENNPEGKQIDYVIDTKGKFKAITEWRYMTEKARRKQNDHYVEHGVKLPKKDEDVYLYYIKLKDGFGNITDHTVDKWIQAYPSLDVRMALEEMQERYERSPHYTKKSWFFGVTGELAKKERKG